ncbi:MAG: TonB family protein [Desulfobacterales bacterium]|nr:TonB family protein [Desulfobacterales bacterium]
MSMHAHISESQDDTPAQALAPAVTFSTLCHVLIFAVLVFASGHRSERRFVPSVIHINMVSLPQAGASAAPPSPRAPVKARSPVEETPEPVVVSTAAKRAVVRPAAVSLSPKTEKRKTSLKKETYRPVQVVRKAIRRIEKQVDAGKPNPIATAMDRLKAKVAATSRPSPGSGAGSSRAGLPASGAGGNQDLELIDIYRVEIAFQIQKNWAFSESLAGARKDLSAELAFTVLPDGRIQDIWFDKRSGNRYLDESARKAVVKSNPVPPHPAGILRPYVTVGLRFTPEGVSR